jgi:type I restriction enzyme M protein
MAVQAERKEIEAEIAKLNYEMDQYLEELGYGA